MSKETIQQEIDTYIRYFVSAVANKVDSLSDIDDIESRMKLAANELIELRVTRDSVKEDICKLLADKTKLLIAPNYKDILTMSRGLPV